MGNTDSAVVREAAGSTKKVLSSLYLFPALALVKAVKKTETNTP
jgi:hypothetical protein